MRRPGFLERALEAILPGFRRDVLSGGFGAEADRDHRALDALEEVRTESPPCAILATPTPAPVARTPRSAAIAPAAAKDFPVSTSSKTGKRTGFALMSREAHAAASRKGAESTNRKRWAK